MKSLIALLVVAFAAAGCTTTHITRNSYAEESGASIGATSASGNVSLTNPLLQALNGGLVGGVSSTLSPSDRARALEAEYRALEYSPAGKAVDWSDPATGIHGEVVAAQPYQVGSQNCRQYTHTVYAGAAAPQSARGTACRNQNGSWTPLS